MMKSAVRDLAGLSLGEIGVSNPAVISILETLGLDYCCNGKRTLNDACCQAGVDLTEAIQKIQSCPEESSLSHDSVEWAHLSPAKLCGHIVATHHNYLRTELPRLAGLLEKVIAAHWKSHPELLELRNVYSNLVDELVPHMAKEERVLFPAICELEAHCGSRFPFGSVRNPIRMMEHEHYAAGDLLAQLRSLTGGFQVPADACVTWRLLSQGLYNLERDLHLHIHKENNLLFPAATHLEQ